MATESQKSQSTSKSGKPSANHGRPRVSKDEAPRAEEDKSKKSTNSSTGSTPSEEERRKESSKLSQQALAAQNKAQELRQAANGAADPDERQHLMEEAINKQIEAESFGKTAKYLQSGTFQGMAVGTGMGTVPGLTLGTLTGTLVGGTVSIITGGVGGAVGAATGALHGPFWDMGKLAGKGIRKVTGDLPGWKATGEQKATLEKMIGQVNEQEPPSEKDLTSMAGWYGQGQDSGNKQTWAEQGASYLPSMSTAEPEGKDRAGDSGAKAKPKTAKPAAKDGRQATPSDQTKSNAEAHTSNASRAQGPNQYHQQASDPPKAPSTRSRRSSNHQPGAPASQKRHTDTSSQTSTKGGRKAPRKIRRSQPDSAGKTDPTSSPKVRRNPRKLEVRKRENGA